VDDDEDGMSRTSYRQGGTHRSLVFADANGLAIELSRQSSTPELLLVLAVMESAIAEARGEDRRLRREARAWIASDTTSWAFSFLGACDVLDLDPAAVREMLDRGPERPRGRLRASTTRFVGARHRRNVAVKYRGRAA